MPKLCVLPGDGIGQEVIPAAVEVLQAVIPDIEVVTAEAGWECFRQYGTSLPEESLEAVRACGAGLFGAVSSPSYKVEGYRSTILMLRQALGLYANIRPVISWPNVSPRDDVDMIIVRENSEGLYSGRERSDGETAVAERVITRKASQRIAKRAVMLAQLLGRKCLTIVHKANVLPLSDGLFRDSVREVIEHYNENTREPLAVDELLVDVAALELNARPQRFDMVVTTNLFGDILSDAAAYWGGGLGMAPSLNWGDEIAVAEPVHGSAPDIAGKEIANPIAAILSGALLVRLVWQNKMAAERIESAVSDTLASNIDLTIGTAAITEAILKQL
ncbi:MAG: isocitrate/isopropylmalate dehydrogenase family protein [Candidatus Promineifilaceae bacterium]|jgi:homoisocitrate dehydrogenase